MRIGIFLIASLVLARPAYIIQAADLRTELAERSQTSGLALVSADAGYIDVVPFDSEEHYLRSPYRFPIAAFGKAGRMVLWWTRRSFLDTRGVYVIDSVDGRELIGRESRVSGFHPVSLSEKGEKIAFVAITGPGESYLGWASFDFRSQGYIDTNMAIPDWSPAGDALLYDSGGEIRLFGITAGLSRRIASGRSPTWRPDAENIAFIRPDGVATLITLEGVPVRSPLDAHRPLGHVRWSPDGRYVSLVEGRSGQSGFVDLIVSRVSDGETIVVKTFGHAATNSDSFHWILGYRTFCAGCSAIPGPR